MFAVYILYSLRYSKTYVGCTSNLIQRFYSHNYLGNKGWTIRYRPWEVIYVEIFEDKREALDREQFLKSGLGRRYIKENLLCR